MYPFAGLTFDDFVEKYISILPQLSSQNSVNRMFRLGKYVEIVEEEQRFYGDRLKSESQCPVNFMFIVALESNSVQLQPLIRFDKEAVILIR